jgi:hypothetical protein
MPDRHRFSTTERFKDGTPVTVRTLNPDDKPRLVAAFRALEPESIYTRFFEYRSEIPEAEIDRALAADFAHEVVCDVGLAKPYPTGCRRTLTGTPPGGIVAGLPLAEADHVHPQAAHRYPDLPRDPRGRLRLHG